jgi:pimeloyl-ACP methyl ester carboxylesterase
MPLAWARATALALAVLLAGCASVGVTRVGPQAVNRTLTASAISTGEPSLYSLQFLQRLGLHERFDKDPAGALAAIQASLEPTGQEYRLFALAELSFLHAERTGSKPYYLAAAVYAYAVLFPEGAGIPPEPLDPRVRLAADLYNLGLTEGLMGEDGQEVRLAAGRYPLPFGELEVSLDQEELVWAGRRLGRFAPAANLAVHGLRNRYRQAGLGAPLAASLEPLPAGTPLPAYSRVPSILKVPVTAFLRLDGARRDLVTGHVRGRLELFSKDAEAVTTVDGHEVPVEYQPTAALAYTLDGVPVWRNEIRGFLRGDLSEGKGGQLFAMTPYRAGRVPVVLVHGTVSSPSRWAELINELDSDPRIGPRCQFWLFTYNTGNPLLYSAAILREALQEAVAQLDPDGRDPALRRMVVIGHSQGGLLTRLTVVDSGTKFWDNVSTTPLSDLRVSPETRALLERSLFVRPLPFVTRVIFMATPHRGSDVAGRLVERFRGLIRWALTLPPQLVKGSAELLSGSDDPLIRRTLAQGLPRSLDNMSPSNRAIRTLSSLPLAPGVTAHSIIAVQDEGPPEDGGDGVVSYRSAHLDGVASEKIVRSGHSVQSNPEAIEEVRRILLEHPGP